GAARDDDVARPGAEHLVGGADGDGAGGAGGGDGLAGSVDAEVQADAAGRAVDDAERGELRGDPAGAASGEGGGLAVVEGQSAVGGADDDADPAAVPDGRVEPGVGDGLAGGDDGELGETVHQPLGGHPEDGARVAVGDGVEEVAGQVGQFGPGRGGRREA